MSLTLTLGPYTLAQGAYHGEDGEPAAVAERRLRAEFAADRDAFAAFLDEDTRGKAPPLSERARPALLFALWLMARRDFHLVAFTVPPDGGFAAPAQSAWGKRHCAGTGRVTSASASHGRRVCRTSR